MFVASLIVNVALLLVIGGQAATIRSLKSRPAQPAFTLTDESKAEIRRDVSAVGEVGAIKKLRQREGLSLLDAKTTVDAARKRDDRTA